MKNPMFLQNNKSTSEIDNNEMNSEETCNDKAKDTLDKKKNVKKKNDNYSITYKDVIIKKSYQIYLLINHCMKIVILIKINDSIRQDLALND